MIFIASDHGGFELKKQLKNFLEEKGEQIEDLGPHTFDPEDDYPDFTKKLTEKMSEIPQSRGVLICRNGVGVTIAANRLHHIRAGLSWNPEHAASSRGDDDTNVLTLPADYISAEEAIKILDIWLTTDFSDEKRHLRRITKLA